MVHALKVMPGHLYKNRGWSDWVELLYCDKCNQFGPHPSFQHVCGTQSSTWGALLFVLGNFQTYAVAPSRVYDGAWKKVRKALDQHPHFANMAAQQLVLAGWGNREEAQAVLRAVEVGDTTFKRAVPS